MNEKESPAASRVESVIALLAQRWPRAFAVRESKRRPLKVGIHADVLAVLDGAVSAAELGGALGSYTKSSGYVRRLTRKGAERIDLNGAPAGEVSPEEANSAVMELSLLVWRHAARRGEGRRDYDDD
jgi:ProP effector